jgi:hypothetical protein
LTTRSPRYSRNSAELSRYSDTDTNRILCWQLTDVLLCLRAAGSRVEGGLDQGKPRGEQSSRLLRESRKRWSIRSPTPHDSAARLVIACSRSTAETSVMLTNCPTTRSRQSPGLVTTPTFVAHQAHTFAMHPCQHDPNRTAPTTGSVTPAKIPRLTIDLTDTGRAWMPAPARKAQCLISTTPVRTASAIPLPALAGAVTNGADSPAATTTRTSSRRVLRLAHELPGRRPPRSARKILLPLG